MFRCCPILKHLFGHLYSCRGGGKKNSGSLNLYARILLSFKHPLLYFYYYYHHNHHHHHHPPPSSSLLLLLLLLLLVVVVSTFFHYMLFIEVSPL